MRAAVLAGFLLFGCAGASQEFFYPAAANSRVGDLPAAGYQLPATGPRGEVRVTSLGETEVRRGPRAAEDVTVTVRLVVGNRQDAVPWAVDVRRVALAFAGEPPATPVEVRVEGRNGRSPIVWIPPGAERTIDFYFAVPPELAGHGALPGFDVVWQVQTGAGVVAHRTRFLRRTTLLGQRQR